MNPYKFLLDRDVSKAAALFPAGRARTSSDVGLGERASDRAIVEKAWELQAIIVTSNGDDFLREVRRFLRLTKKKDCHDLFGLLILPSKFEIQKRSLAEIGNRLRFGGKKISWHDVWGKNLCVRVRKTGSPQITQLPRCFYCEKASRN